VVRRRLSEPGLEGAGTAAPVESRRTRRVTGAYGRLVAYDVEAESRRLIADGLRDQTVRLSRRHRFVPLAVDVDGDIACTRFVRRGAGCFHDETHLLTRAGHLWTYRGGGGGDYFDRWSTDEFYRARDELGPDGLEIQGGPSVRLDYRWLPLPGRSVRATHLLVGRSVIEVVVDGRRRLMVPGHGRLAVVWASRRPPRVSARDAAGRELASTVLPRF
jgi:hypothetical protein